jgi:hypothetical protein
MKLGRNPSTKEVTFKFAAFSDRRKLPQPPRTFGNEEFLPKDGWGVLGNDKVGNCVIAGAAHETLLWCNVGQTATARFDETSVLADYSRIAGYDPRRPETDQGTDMSEAASYRRRVGVRDADGNPHKVAAYLAIDADDVVAHYQALWLFEAVGIGFKFPMSAWRQFEKGLTWSVLKNASFDGGHYVPLVAKRRSLVCVTWGKTQTLTRGFLERYNEESLAYISPEALKNQKSQEGFDYQGLLDALNSLPRAA